MVQCRGGLGFLREAPQPFGVTQVAAAPAPNFFSHGVGGLDPT